MQDRLRAGKWMPLAATTGGLCDDCFAATLSRGSTAVHDPDRPLGRRQSSPSTEVPKRVAQRVRDH
jgi:hypothetical protein